MNYNPIPFQLSVLNSVDDFLFYQFFKNKIDDFLAPFIREVSTLT